MTFLAAAGVAVHEAAEMTQAQTTQAQGVSAVVSTNVSLLTTGQHPVLKRDPVLGKNPEKSQADADGILQGIQSLIAASLGRAGATITDLHKAVMLGMAQPGGWPELLTPGHKPSRDVYVQGELARTRQKLATSLVTGQGLVRYNELRAEAAKTFFRQAGQVIYDTAGTLFQASLTQITETAKRLVRAADYDLVVDTLTQHVNNWFVAAQQAMIRVAGRFTVSIGGKAKVVLHDESELVALKQLVLTLQDKLELITNGAVELKSGQRLTLRTNLVEVVLTNDPLTGLSISAPALTLKAGGAEMSFGPLGIDVSPNLIPPVPMPVVAVPLAVPLASVPAVDGGEPAPGPVSTAVNPGRTSGPAVMPYR